MKSKMFRAVLVKENDLEYWIIASGAFKASEMKFKTKKTSRRLHQQNRLGYDYNSYFSSIKF